MRVLKFDAFTAWITRADFLGVGCSAPNRVLHFRLFDMQERERVRRATLTPFIYRVHEQRLRLQPTTIRLRELRADTLTKTTAMPAIAPRGGSAQTPKPRLDDGGSRARRDDADESRDGRRDRRPSSSRTPLSVSPSSSAESLLARQQARPRPLKVVIIGPESVGKTTLRGTYFTNRFQRNYKATIGADFEAKVVEYKGRDAGSEANRKVLLSVWDTAGQERFRALGSAFYRGADAVIVCFDASSHDEEDVKRSIGEWFRDFKSKSTLNDEQLKSFCWVAVGCKSDLREDGAVARRQVRTILDGLLARIGQGRDAGTARRRNGDAPPAPPHDVLSRQGIHKEDDRELGLDASDLAAVDADGSSSIDAGKDSASRSVEDPDMAPIAETQQYTIDEEPKPGSAAIPASASTSATSTRDVPAPGPVAFPCHTPSSSPRTPTKASMHMPQSQRNRFDSNISMASSSQLSVYHTPRNSNFFGSTPATTTTATATTSNAGNAHRRYLSSSITPSASSSSTIGLKGKGKGKDMMLMEEADGVQTTTTTTRSNGQDTTTAAVGASKNDTTAPPTLRRPRALSTASEQSTIGAQSDGEGPTEESQQPLPRRRLPHRPPLPTSGFSLFYTSALTGQNVHAVFEHIVSRCSRAWAHDDYYSTVQLQRRRKLAEIEKQKEDKRRSVWRNTFRLRKTSEDADGDARAAFGLNTREEEELKRIQSETRRMVRVSDGKGDDAQRGFGGCCT